MGDQTISVVRPDEAAAGAQLHLAKLEEYGITLGRELPRIATRVCIRGVLHTMLRERLRGRKRSCQIDAASQCRCHRALRNVLPGIPEDGVDGHTTDGSLVIHVALVELAEGIGQTLTSGLHLGQAFTQSSPATKLRVRQVRRFLGRLQVVLRIREAISERVEFFFRDLPSAAQLPGHPAQAQGHHVNQKEVSVKALCGRTLDGISLGGAMQHLNAADSDVYGNTALRATGNSEPDMVVQTPF
mmetsp:Transcript_90205/g.291613  ORF Transcript_90205/g.291613 Transcript_90205/m.291613 type:complete len:243 (-) Transcript_90205:1236-1964(-)